MFRAGVLAEWARAELGAALDYVAELDGVEQQRALLGIVQRLSDEQLALLIAEAGRFEPQAALRLRQVAAQRLAQTDPVQALSLVATLPPHERQEVQGSIGFAYGSKDPEAAFAWAQSLDPRDPQAIRAVLTGIATADPERALDLALSLESPFEREQAVHSVATAGLRAGREEHVLNRLAALDDAAVRARAMATLLGIWSSQAPRRAFDWLAANAHRVPAEAFQHVGARLAQHDPAAAAAFTDRVPAAARPSWVAAVASGYASGDPEGAVAWISRFRNDPAYRNVVATTAMALAQRDAPAAARLLETGGELDEAGARAAATVVAQWVQQDPTAAAAWAARLDPRARSMALTMAAQQWSLRDPDGARHWALGMPPGAARDEALAGVSASPFSRAVPDEEVLAAFSSDEARHRALVQMAARLAQHGEVERARTLIDERIVNESLRAHAHTLLEQATHARPAPFFVPPGVPIMPPTLPLGGPGAVSAQRSIGVVSPAGVAVPVDPPADR